VNSFELLGVSQVRYLIKALHVSFTNVEKVAIIYTDLLSVVLPSILSNFITINQ
jgi:hypothetical protein